MATLTQVELDRREMILNYLSTNVLKLPKSY